MIAVGIIAVLAALVFGGLPTLKARVHRTGCANHIRQQLVGFQLYAADNNDRYYWPSTSASADNAPQYLYPRYVPDINVFVCPATKNVVRENVRNRLTGQLVDLENNALNALSSAGGHSYEYFAFYSIPASQLPDGNQPYPNRKRPNHFWRDASETLLVLDGDDYGINNYPDPENNHGAEGWNWGFADGHVRWIRAHDTQAALLRAGQGGG